MLRRLIAFAFTAALVVVTIAPPTPTPQVEAKTSQAMVSEGSTVQGGGGMSLNDQIVERLVPSLDHQAITSCYFEQYPAYGYWVCIADQKITWRHPGDNTEIQYSGQEQPATNTTGCEVYNSSLRTLICSQAGALIQSQWIFFVEGSFLTPPPGTANPALIRGGGFLFGDGEYQRYTVPIPGGHAFYVSPTDGCNKACSPTSGIIPNGLYAYTGNSCVMDGWIREGSASFYRDGDSNTATRCNGITTPVAFTPTPKPTSDCFVFAGVQTTKIDGGCLFTSPDGQVKSGTFPDQWYAYTGQAAVCIFNSSVSGTNISFYLKTDPNTFDRCHIPTPTPTNTVTPTKTPTLTYTPTKTATPMNTATPTKTATPVGVHCSPRPRVLVNVISRLEDPTVPAENLKIVLKSTTNPTGALNRIKAIEFTPDANANVPFAGNPNFKGWSTLPGVGATEVTFRVKRLSPTQGAMVSLIVRDECGDWPTFVGGGKNAGF